MENKGQSCRKFKYSFMQIIVFVIGVIFLTVTTVTTNLDCLLCENEFFWHFTWCTTLVDYTCMTKRQPAI